MQESLSRCGDVPVITETSRCAVQFFDLKVSLLISKALYKMLWILRIDCTVKTRQLVHFMTSSSQQPVQLLCNEIHCGCRTLTGVCIHVSSTRSHVWYIDIRLVRPRYPPGRLSWMYFGDRCNFTADQFCKRKLLLQGG